MSEVQGQSRKLSPLTSVRLGLADGHVLFDSQRLQMAGILDNKPALPEYPYQVVIFPYEEESELSVAARMRMAPVESAFARRIVACGAELAVEHKEGRNLPGHAHKVLFGSWVRNDGKRLYERPETVYVEPEVLALAVARLTFSEGQVTEVEHAFEVAQNSAHLTYVESGPLSIFTERS